MKLELPRQRLLAVCIVTIASLVLAACGNSGNSGANQNPIFSTPLADVIIAIDSSGSMAAEIGFVQALINNFAASITAAGIDLHIIVIADGAQFCAPPPLGAVACPAADENLPGYRHDPTWVVGSNNAFDQILATYPAWSGSLRSGANKILIVVSDDDSTMMTWQNFDMQLLVNPGFNGYRFHAFVASVTPLAEPCLNMGMPLSNAAGTQYIALANDSGGIFTDLCRQNFGVFSPGFGDIAAQIILDS